MMHKRHIRLVMLLMVISVMAILGHHLLINHDAGATCLLSFCAFIVTITLFIIPMQFQALPTVELAAVQREHTDTFFKPPRS